MKSRPRRDDAGTTVYASKLQANPDCQAKIQHVIGKIEPHLCQMAKALPSFHNFHISF